MEEKKHPSLRRLRKIIVDNYRSLPIIIQEQTDGTIRRTKSTARRIEPHRITERVKPHLTRDSLRYHRERGGERVRAAIRAKADELISGKRRKRRRKK